MEKYTLVKFAGIYTEIRVNTGTEIEPLLRVVFPSEISIATWSHADLSIWIVENNIRMGLICKLLNDQNL